MSPVLIKNFVYRKMETSLGNAFHKQCALRLSAPISSPRAFRRCALSLLAGESLVFRLNFVAGQCTHRLFSVGDRACRLIG